jgi:hypothetical protein
MRAWLLGWSLVLAVPAAANEQPTNGGIVLEDNGWYRGQELFLVGAGERLPLDVAALDNVMPIGGVRRVYLWPGQVLRPSTLYDVELDGGHVVKWICTGLDPDPLLPEWAGVPSLLRERRDVQPMRGRIRTVTVRVPSRWPVAFVRSQAVCPDGRVVTQFPAKVHDGVAELPASCGSDCMLDLADAAEVILALEDPAGNVSAPRVLRLGKLPPTVEPRRLRLVREPPPWPGPLVGLLLFGVLPFGLGYVGVRCARWALDIINGSRPRRRGYVQASRRGPTRHLCRRSRCDRSGHRDRKTGG